MLPTKSLIPKAHYNELPTKSSLPRAPYQELPGKINLYLCQFPHDGIGLFIQIGVYAWDRLLLSLGLEQR